MSKLKCCSIACSCVCADKRLPDAENLKASFYCQCSNLDDASTRMQHDPGGHSLYSGRNNCTKLQQTEYISIDDTIY